MMPTGGMQSYDVGTMVYDTMARQTDTLDGPQRLLLAARLTATSVDPLTGIRAVACPACYEPDRGQATNPRDPTCLGTGFVIPNSAGATDANASGVQHGYLTPRPFEGLLIKGGTTATEDEQGIIEATEDILSWPAQRLSPKKLDIVIRTDYPDLVSERFLIRDALEADALGSRVIAYKATIALLDRGDMAYSIPTPDLGPGAAGTWD